MVIGEYINMEGRSRGTVDVGGRANRSTVEHIALGCSQKNFRLPKDLFFSGAAFYKLFLDLLFTRTRNFESK